MKVVVTGGAGFIGSAVCRKFVLQKGWEILNIDKLTYAANLDSLKSVKNHPNYSFKQIDICDASSLNAAINEFKPDKIIHLAAESHVDRSIDDPGSFIQTNLVGTYQLLEASRAYWEALPSVQRDLFRFHHVSTDEVYGSLGDEGLFTEDMPYKPNSPYSASKAGSDHLVRAWYKTYGLPILLSNCSNNYGPHQFPEKLIPLMILNLLRGKKLPIFGEGKNTRDWLHVDDHAEALATVLEKGIVGQKYNVGGHNELNNLTIVRKIFDAITLLEKKISTEKFESHLDFIQDRPGHDWRYAIDATKIDVELGWRPTYTIDDGIQQTVKWYVENQDWWQPILDNTYQGQRLGRKNYK